MDKNLNKFKEQRKKKIIKEIKVHKEEWEREFNKGMVSNSSYKKNNLKLYPSQFIEESNQMAPVPVPSPAPVSESQTTNMDKSMEKYISEKLKSQNMKLSSESIEFLLSSVLKNQNSKLSLLYRLNKTKKKFIAEKFKEKTENKKNVLVLCKNKEGEEFGGFAGTGWNTNDNDFSKNFLFSLSKSTIHPQTKSMSKKNSLEYSENKGPTFGELDLVIGDKCCNGDFSSSYLGNFFDSGKFDAKTHLGSKNSFTLTDCLIYQLKD